jgi:hypothetical protein
MDSQEQPQHADDQIAVEVVDGVIVLADVRAVEPLRHGPSPFVQTAAVAATGFVAGAATAAMLGRRFSRAQARRTGTTSGPSPRGYEPLEVVGSRRFIVDVHTLSRS